MTAIVTGAKGFIATHLIDALAKTGEEVRCLSRGKPSADSRPTVSFHQVDFEHAGLGLGDDVFRGVDTVFHLAGATRAVSAADFTKANVTVTERLMDRFAGLGQRPRFVLVSSQAAAGPARDAQHPKAESDPAAPIEDYGRSKLAAERLVLSRSGDIPGVVLRPVAVYGPGDRDFLSIFQMAKRGLAVFPGIHGASVNTIYVGDLVGGMIAAASHPGAVGQTYFMGDDTAQPWKTIYATIADVVGNRPSVQVKVPRGVVGMAGAAGDIVARITGRPSLVNRSKAVLAAPKYWLCTSERAKADFGFTTPTSLRDGMQMTYDWYLRNRWI
jgi:nucleoside-diphosphate-sugar epimerase